MDQRLKYEQLIAGKLESLPFPDMEDAIWARVKAQLDIDLPPGDDEGGAPQSPTGPGIVGWGLSIVIIALVTAFFINKNPKAKELKNITAPTEQIILPAEQTKGPPGTATSLPSGSRPVKNLPGSPLIQNTVDSVQQQDITIILPNAIDSSKGNPAPPVTLNVPTDSIPSVKKKGKGISGMKDEDYKIVPKKDNE
jgi:hypothetical protein